MRTESSSPSSTAALEKVLNTPELLELLLGQLDPTTLLLSQAVSKGFKAAIDTSPRLQRKLFFRDLPHPSGPKSKSGRDLPTMNPLLFAAANMPEIGFDLDAAGSTAKLGFVDYERSGAARCVAEICLAAGASGSVSAECRRHSCWRMALIQPAREVSMHVYATRVRGDTEQYKPVVIHVVGKDRTWGEMCDRALEIVKKGEWVDEAQLMR